MKKIIYSLFAFSVFLQLVGCGPSKAELEARAKQGEIFEPNTGTYVKVPNNPYEETQTEEPQPLTSSEEIGYDDIEIRVIDSCEYIVWGRIGNSTGNIIHKSNCRNPFHTK